MEEFLGRLGVTTTEAIIMFFSQIRLRRGIPFPVEVPNEITKRTFDVTDRGEEFHTHKSLDEMFRALDKC